VLSARPFPARSRVRRRFPWEPALRGPALAARLQSSDRAAGHPFAWYFHLVADGGVAHEIADAVGEDLKAGFAYLPDADARILAQWIEQPYRL
jgi:hypothetical protein